MEKIYEIDFEALSSAEKSKFVGRLGELAEKSFADYPFEVTINAQLLIFTRWWNSYRLMVPENPTPKIMDIIMEKLWDYQEGKLDQSEFVHFANCLDAVALEIATGDTEKMDEDESYYDFQSEYFEDWDDFYDGFVIELSYLCHEIREHEVIWYGVEELLYGDIADIKIPLFEGIDDVSGGTSAVVRQREQEIYSLPRFCQVIALLQKDMRMVLEGKPIAELRKIYQNEYLFSPEECAKVTSDWL